jgi:hypothetical protein
VATRVLRPNPCSAVPALHRRALKSRPCATARSCVVNSRRVRRSVEPGPWHLNEMLVVRNGRAGVDNFGFTATIPGRLGLKVSLVLLKKRIPLLSGWIDFHDPAVYFRACPAYL